MYKDGKQYDKFILNGKTYDKFYLNNKQYGGGYVPFATPILDLDFQNNFIDKSPSALTMVQGQGLPTFGLSGRKAGEYCAVFNGSQSIKTTTNLPINSDKITIAFWMKKNSFYSNEVIMETGTTYPSSTNGLLDVIITNANAIRARIGVTDAISSYNNNEWTHYVIVIDRALDRNETKVYKNGVFHVQSTGNVTGNFVNEILHIGQRAGSSLGFNGYLTKYQVFNKVPTDAQAMEIYQNDL